MTTTLDDDTSTPYSPGPRWVRWILAVVIALLALMWVYAFVFASERGAYRVDSERWRANAKEICRQARLERIALADTSEGYIEQPTPTQMVQRADVVDRATDIVERMLDDMVALPVESERDREILASFERFYRVIISDRRAYTSRLRNYELRPYEETAIEGGPVTNIVTDFTSGNDLKECAPPGELGGGSL